MAVNRNVSQPKMVGDSGGGKNEGRGIKGLKKGPWTAAEDSILMEYVKQHGEGNWNAVQKNTGLARCGKSCRLRWANHLRPNLKKGSFSADEERVIIELHAKLGNKWARMAAQLPGRTDNEIKNYWNTRMKRRQRAGLPLYPQELHKEVAAIHLQHPLHSETYYSSPPFSSLLSPSPPPKLNFNYSLSLFNPMSLSLAVNSLSSNQHDSAFFSTPTSQFKLVSEDNGASGFSVPISSSFEPVSCSVFTQRVPTQPLSPQALNLNYGRSNFNCNSGFSSMILGSSFEQVIPGLEAELPSIQTPPLSPTTASSGASVGNCETATQTSQANSGLLDALLMEAQAMARNEKVKDYGSSSAVSEKEKQVGEEEYVENHSDESSSSQSSTGVKTMEGQLEESESMDEDLMSLLNNFPSTMPQPLPEWYPLGGVANSAHASYLPATSLPMDMRQNADSPTRIASPDNS